MELIVSHHTIPPPADILHLSTAKAIATCAYNALVVTPLIVSFTTYMAHTLC